MYLKRSDYEALRARCKQLEAELAAEQRARGNDRRAYEAQYVALERDLTESRAVADRANKRAEVVSREADRLTREAERRHAALEGSDPERLTQALVAIRDEPAPILPSDDVGNVHIPGTYVERVRKLANDALTKES